MLDTRLAAPLLCIALLATAAGCHKKSDPTPENFTKGLNAYFLQHPDCLFPDPPRFPYETSDPEKTKQMNTLVESQLLKVSVERDIHVSRYTPTPAGERLAPKFCYGHRVVTSIDSFTPPTTRNGFPESDVTYHYKVEDVPIWANTAAVRAVFPRFASEIGGNATDKATLAATITGWQVPD
jgi:hypothetical protein